MRKFLLATTALVGFAAAGAAQAATSPLNVTVGGSVDFLAGAFHESKAMVNASHSAFDATHEGHGDFETLYSLDFGVKGKASNGVEYGGDLVLDNYPDYNDTPASYSGNSNNIAVTKADIFMSGAFGKLQLGDSRGATDLVLTAPVVGEGQVYGRFVDFVDTNTFAKAFVVGLDGADHSTNITYFTPKVGNENHKVQVGVTYAPDFYNYGSSVVKYDGETADRPYKNVIKGAAAYTGAFKPVTLGLSSHIISATSDTGTGNNKYRDFVSWGVGAEASTAGFTLGGNFVDLGHSNSLQNQQKDQYQYGVGLKYAVDKYGVGISYLGGKGYDRIFDDDEAYVKSFNAYGVGGTYTWAPGLTTNVDGVMFGQKTDVNIKNDGYVLLVSQKLAF